MSLTRAALLARPRIAPVVHLQRRLASSGSHSEHEHRDEHDAIAYPKEGFSAPIWRYSILLSFLVVGFYKFAPTPGEDVSLTRWLAQYGTPSDVWANINVQHLYLSREASEGRLLTADAKKPSTHRYRYPQSFEQVSPHLQPVGSNVDMSGLVVKGDKD